MKSLYILKEEVFWSIPPGSVQLPSARVYWFLQMFVCVCVTNHQMHYVIEATLILSPGVYFHFPEFRRCLLRLYLWSGCFWNEILHELLYPELFGRSGRSTSAVATAFSWRRICSVSFSKKNVLILDSNIVEVAELNGRAAMETNVDPVSIETKNLWRHRH